VFRPPRPDTYHLIIDNSTAWFGAREVVVYAYLVYPRPTPWSLRFQDTTQQLYDSLKAWFMFEDFNVMYGHCGVENAFSSPDITICLELIEALRDEDVHGAYPFVLFHELAHSLLRRWGDDRADDENVADEFAVMASILLELPGNAETAARWFLSRKVELYAGPGLRLGDRHPPSPVRAERILAWLAHPEDLMHKWQPLLVPHMQTDYLRQLNGNHRSWIDHDLLGAELTRREAAPAIRDKREP
jgi:hypothetical protein